MNLLLPAVLIIMIVWHWLETMKLRKLQVEWRTFIDKANADRVEEFRDMIDLLAQLRRKLDS